MASRPFASVAVALDARGEQTELLQPVVDVSSAYLLLYTHTHRLKHMKIKHTKSFCSDDLKFLVISIIPMQF